MWALKGVSSLNVKILTPFLDAFFDVLPMVGFTDIRRGRIFIKEKLMATLDITTLVGLSGNVHGNVMYCMSEDTAKQVASVMMMGMKVEQLDEMSLSAVSELANMLTSGASTLLSNINLFMDISPPTLVTGKNITVMVSQVKTFAAEVITEAGIIEMNVGLEM